MSATQPKILITDDERNIRLMLRTALEGEEYVIEEAADGRYELYKTTARHEGAIGRAQHGFPSDEELTA